MGSSYTTAPGLAPELVATWSVLVLLALLAFRNQWKMPFNPRPRLDRVFISSRHLRRGVGGTVIEPARRFPIPTDD